MSNKLSHSSCNRYLKCPESYRLHYQERLRPTVTSASLLLGSALDEALNALLLKDGRDYLQVFEDTWTYQFINKTRTDLRFSTKVVYAAKDLDIAILTNEDRALLRDSDTDRLIGRYKQRAHIAFTEAEHENYNHLNWLCLRRKGYLILDAYVKIVLPKIKKVIAVQKQVNFDNGCGDAIVGVIDLIAELDDGVTYVLDHKSSSTKYELDSAKMSPQLALYGKHEGIADVGFIVFSKNIVKNKVMTCGKCGFIRPEGKTHKTCSNEIGGDRCKGEWLESVNPEAEIQIILDKVNDNMAVATMDNFKQVNNLINNKVFFKNTHSCDSWYGNNKCPYYNKCFNNSEKELEKI